MKSFKYTLLLLCMCNPVFGDGLDPFETWTTTKPPKFYINDENCNARFDKQFETLMNWNDGLQRKMVLMQKDLERQLDEFNEMQQIFSKLPLKLEETLEQCWKICTFEKPSQAVDTTDSDKLELIPQIYAKVSNIAENIVTEHVHLTAYNDILQSIQKLETSVCNSEHDKKFPFHSIKIKIDD